MIFKPNFFLIELYKEVKVKFCINNKTRKNQKCKTIG